MSGSPAETNGMKAMRPLNDRNASAMRVATTSIPLLNLAEADSDLLPR
jgi:hypothetical protein